MTLQTAAFSTRVVAGEGLPVELVWRDERQLGGAYSVFVHLDDATGRLIAQHDGVPAAGLRPTAAWRPGDVIDDRHGLLLPADITLGAYRLDVGMYQVNGARLSLPDGRDAVTLGEVQVAH